MSAAWKTIYKALYKEGKITKQKIKSKKNGKLTEEEVFEIIEET